MLDGLVEAARPGGADRRIGGARVVEREGGSTSSVRSRSGPPSSAARASGASSSAMPRFVLAPATRRVARTAASTVSPTPRSAARPSSGPSAIALRSMSS